MPTPAPCPECQDPLRTSRWTTDHQWKACPECSGREGMHIYHPYPEAFGETDARASGAQPDGPQSWCAACRSQQAQIPGWTCAEVRARSHQDTGVPFPPRPLSPQERERIGDIELTPEGKKRLALHFGLERSRTNRIRVLHHRRASTGALTCDGCDLDLARELGLEFAELVELHHNVPLAAGPQRPTLASFALLCPTCHRAVHFRREVPLTTAELRQLRQRS